MSSRRFDRYAYDSVAAFYDELAAIYSRGRIARAKRVVAEFVGPGDRVCLPGVGRGGEVRALAEKGAHVTGLDLSPAMLRRARRRAAGLEPRPEFLEADAGRFEPARPFDVVAAQFFLDLYSEETCVAMLERLVQWLRPGGLLVITDFEPPPDRGAGRWVGEAYYRPLNLAAWCVGLADSHPLPDYAPWLEKLGLRLIRRVRVPIFHEAGPACCVWVATLPREAPRDP